MTAVLAKSSAIGNESHWSVEDATTDEDVRSSAFSDDWLPLTATITLYIEPTLREAAWLDDLLDDLRDVVALKANWNGCGERSIHASSVKRAVDILNRMQPTISRPHVVPLSSGAVQLEWHGPDLSIEVEVPPEGPAVGNAYSDDDEVDIEWKVAGQPNDGRGVAQLNSLLADRIA